MRISLGRIFVFAIVLIASIVLLSGSVTAANLPLLDYTGNFDYLYSHQECNSWKKNGTCNGYETVYDWNLTFPSINITGGNYMDGSYFGDGTDAITNAYFQFGSLYNDDSPSNLSFDNTAGTGGGPVSFSITDGTNTFLSGTLGNFVIADDFFGTNLYSGSITNVTYGSAPYSQYISELQLTNEPFNLDMNFVTTSGPSGSGSAFTADSSGTVGGKLEAGNMSVAPEPLSSILFLSGSAALALRSYRKKKHI
jgi:hypothetical protein